MIGEADVAHPDLAQDRRQLLFAWIATFVGGAVVAHPDLAQDRRQLLFAWIATFVGGAVVAGAYLDGWAHNHGKVDQSFFTPWHAVLYGSVALAGIFFFGSMARHHVSGRPWRDALPSGYLLSALGVLLFGIGGVLDLIWQTLFGIEADTEALVSPTHLVLATAAVLICTGPLRAAWHKQGDGRLLSWRQSGPAILSVVYVVSLLAFMTQFANPVTDVFATGETDGSGPLASVNLMGDDGSKQTRLTIDPERWHGFGAWSPDGSRMVITAGVPPVPSDLFIMNSDGTNLIQLTHTQGSDYTASWAPDGTKIAFISNPNGNPDVYVVNVDGSGETRLTTTAEPEWGTSWSPDSRSIAFSSLRTGRWEIYVMRSDGSGQQALTAGHGSSLAPAWSPDGRRIAYQRDVKGTSQLFVMDVDGANQRPLASGIPAYQPTWSPDGDRLAFASFRGPEAQIFVVRADGGEAVNLTRSPGVLNSLPNWSPDGKNIAFTSEIRQASTFETRRRLGLASHLLQAAILMGPLLLIVRRWALPWGALTLILFLVALLGAVLQDQYYLIPSAFLAGVVGDFLLLRLRWAARRPALFYQFAFLLPVVFYGFYFLAVQTKDGIDWSIHLSAGVTVMSGIVGLLLSFLISPPFAASQSPVTNF